LTGTKMVGIKKLLEFWMKVKNVEKNRDSVLKAKQIKMLEDREVVEQALKNIHDVDMWPTMLEQVGVDLEKTSVQAEVMTMETEPAAIRFNYEDGKLTRVFDCAEVQEKIVMNSGVKEKLAQLQTLENIRKEEERRMKKRYTWKNGKNMVVQKKRGRPFKNSNLKRLTMGQKSGNHGKIKKTDGKGHKETANMRTNNQTRKRGRAKNPVELEETDNVKRWRQKEPVGSAPPLFSRRSIMSKKMKEEYNRCKEKEQSGVDDTAKDMGKTTNPEVAFEKLVGSIREDKVQPFQDIMAFTTTMENFVELNKLNQIPYQELEENHSEIVQIEIEMEPNHYDSQPLNIGGDSQPLYVGGDSQSLHYCGDYKPHCGGGDSQPLNIGGDSKPLNIGGDSKPLHVFHDGDSQESSLLPNTSGDFQQVIPINDIQSTKAFEDSAATNPLNSSDDN